MMHEENEKKTLFIIIITVITMAVEIFYGYFSNSMALLADGYHMGTHVLALGLTYTAYVLARKYSNIFDTSKIGTLAAYTSSLFLGLTGLWIIIEAIQRFFNPHIIMFNEAIVVAIIGFVINTICILIMEKGHKEDYNFKAAYYHIMADALTSILAIMALFAGKFFQLTILDPVIGIIGGILIIKWSLGLLKDTVKVLIDMNRTL